MAKLGHVVEREQTRIENGGDGGSEQVLVQPEPATESAAETKFQSLSGEEAEEERADAPEVEAKEEEAEE